MHSRAIQTSWPFLGQRGRLATARSPTHDPNHTIHRGERTAPMPQRSARRSRRRRLRGIYAFRRPRVTRAGELSSKLADVIAFASRLAFIVEAAIR
jgi:hypothetical protein